MYIVTGRILCLEMYFSFLSISFYSYLAHDLNPSSENCKLNLNFLPDSELLNEYNV